MPVPQSKWKRLSLDLGPCRISDARFAYLNKRKYHSELTRLETADYLAFMFFRAFGYNLDLLSPRTFNEKLNWLKIFYHNPVMHICADKARCPTFIREKLPGMDSHHVEIYKIFYSPEELDFTALPEKFIIKSNCGSNAQLFVDKSVINSTQIQKIVTRWFDPRRNHYYLALEYSYKGIPPAVVCERIIEYEYKIEFFCFDGQPFFYWIVLGDKTKNARANYYTMTGERLKFSRGYKNFMPDLPRPNFFDELADASQKLSAGFPHVRVDFYAAKDTWYFSELTFYTGAGLKPFSPFEFDLLFGNHIPLREFA